MVGLQDEIIQYTKEMGINGAISLFEDKSIIELATKNITSCQKKFLEKNYGDYIKITADYEEPFEAKNNTFSQGFQVQTSTSGGYFGFSVSSTPDIKGNIRSNLVIGAYNKGLGYTFIVKFPSCTSSQSG